MRVKFLLTLCYIIIDDVADCCYRGYRILNAIMDDLNTNRGLTYATDVLLTGCSGEGGEKGRAG